MSVDNEFGPNFWTRTGRIRSVHDVGTGGLIGDTVYPGQIDSYHEFFNTYYNNS